MKNGFLNTNFGSIYFEQYGEIKPDQTLVFLHDAIGAVSIFGSFLPYVHEKTGYTVFAFDRLGYGKSSQDNVERQSNYLNFEAEVRLPEILNLAGIKQPILIGHSDGASIALIYASLYPTTGVFSMAAHIYVESETLCGIERFFTSQDLEYWIEKLEKHHGKKAHKLLMSWRNTWVSESFKNWNISNCLSEISCPVFALQGTEDEYATDNHLNDIKRFIGQHCCIHFIKKCGHTPYKTHREYAANLISEWLEKMEEQPFY